MGILDGMFDSFKNMFSQTQQAAAPADGAMNPTPSGGTGLLDNPMLGTLGMGLLGASGSGFLPEMMMLKMMGENGFGNDNKQPNTQPGAINQNQAPQIPQINPLQSPYKVNGLNPRLQAALPYIMETLKSKGWQPTISSGLRTPAEQAEKVRQGYSQTMNSKHLIGKAVDITDKRYGWDGAASDTNYQFWKDLGAAAKSQGLQWGGDWKNFKDVAHIQTSLLNQQRQQQMLKQRMNMPGNSYYA